MIASSISKRPYRHLPDPRELNARLWKDPEFHMRLWTDPALRDAYAKVIHEALKNAITGKLAMEEVGLTLADIIANQVHGELTILGLRDDFTHCIEAIRNIVLGRVLAKMANMQTRFGLRDEHDDAH